MIHLDLSSLLIGIALGIVIRSLFSEIARYSNRKAEIRFTEPVKADAFMRVRDEYYADMLRQIQPKYKSANVL